MVPDPDRAIHEAEIERPVLLGAAIPVSGLREHHAHDCGRVDRQSGEAGCVRLRRLLLQPEAASLDTRLSRPYRHRTRSWGRLNDLISASAKEPGELSDIGGIKCQLLAAFFGLAEGACDQLDDEATPQDILGSVGMIAAIRLVTSARASPTLTTPDYPLPDRTSHGFQARYSIARCNDRAYSVSEHLHGSVDHEAAFAGLGDGSLAEFYLGSEVGCAGNKKFVRSCDGT